MALILLFAILLWINSPFNFVLEDQLSKLNLLLKHSIPIGDLPINKSDLLFVDVSGSSSVVSTTEGKEIIADRKALDSLFRYLKKFENPGLIVVCDIHFDLATPQDRLLEKSMSALPSLITSQAFDEKGKPLPSRIHAGTSGTSNFIQYSKSLFVFSNSLLKFRLVDEHQRKTIPLLMFEKFTDKKSSLRWGFLQIGGKLYFNTILINEQLELSTEQIDYRSHVKPIALLNKMFSEARSDYVNELKGKKMVIIGDFKRDTHELVGRQKPGPIVICDLFLSLCKGENRIPSWYALLTFCFFTFLIYHSLHLRSGFNRFLDGWAHRMGLKRHPKLNWLLIYCYSLLSMIFLGINIEVIAGSVFLWLLLWLNYYYRSRKRMIKQGRHGKSAPRYIYELVFKNFRSN